MRQRRWLELVKDYDRSINYHPSKTNVMADALSRKPSSFSAALLTTQMEIMDEVRSGKKPEFSISEDGALRFGSRPFMPNDPLIKKEILEETHYSSYAIHPSSTKMYHDIRENFWWNNMKREIAHFVEQCLTC